MPGHSAFAFVDEGRTCLTKLESYITTGMDNCEDLCLDLVENGKENAEQHLTELKETMLDYIRMEMELKHFLEATDAVKRMAKHSDEQLDLVKLLDEKLEELSASNMSEDLTEHSRYVDLENKIKDLKATVSPIEDSTISQNLVCYDEEMEIKQEVVTKCPYTGREMKDPVMNRHCKHNYDREGINQAMKLRKGKTRCPVAGCINDKPISAADLEDNHELRRYIDMKNRHTEKRHKKSQNT